MPGPSTTAREITRELLEVPFQESIDSFSHGLGAAPEEDIDSRLVETHKRPHAHSACNENLNTVLGQVIDRGHAPALLVRYVRQSADILDLSVRDFNEGIEIAVPEVSTDKRVQPSRVG